MLMWCVWAPSVPGSKVGLAFTKSPVSIDNSAVKVAVWLNSLISTRHLPCISHGPPLIATPLTLDGVKSLMRPVRCGGSGSGIWAVAVTPAAATVTAANAIDTRRARLVAVLLNQLLFMENLQIMCFAGSLI